MVGEKGQPATPAGTDDRQQRQFIQGTSSWFLPRWLGSTRLFIGIAVGGLLTAAVITLVYGFLLVFRTIWDTITDTASARTGPRPSRSSSSS